MKIGLQLYSIREEVEKDFEGTLKKVAEMGYDCVEFAGFYGHSAKEVKEMCEKYGLEPVSSHQGYLPFKENPEEIVKYHKELGVKYCIVPGVPQEMLEEKYDEMISDFKIFAELLKKEGIKFAFHNHEHEFYTYQKGKHVMEAMLDDVTPELLQYEFDVCWLLYAGIEPCEYIRRFKDVQEIIHIKDFKCLNLPEDFNYVFPKGETFTKRDREETGMEHNCILGKGVLDCKGVIDAVKETNIEYLIIEHEKHNEGEFFSDVKKDLDYLRSLIQV